MKYAVKSTTYGTMKTFDNEHDAVSAMNTYNWTTENDRAYIEKEEETMTANTTIDTSKGGPVNAFIDTLTKKGYTVTKADAPNANFECFNATITDKSGYGHITIFFGQCDGAHITARVDKVNGTHKWYYGKTLAQMLSIVRQCMEGYDWEKPTKTEIIEAMDDDAEDPSVTLDDFINTINDTKEDDTMGTTLFEIIRKTAHITDEATIEKIASHILENGEPSSEAKAVNATIEAMEEMGLRTAEVGDKVKMGGTTFTIAKLHYAQLFQSSYEPSPDDGWMIEFMDTNGGYHYWKQYLDGGEFIKATAEDNTTTNNEEEETTMKTTNTSNPVTINLTEGTARFELNGITYKYNIGSKRYAKTTPDGKTIRIGKAEYDEAKAEYDQQVLDDQPSRVEVENDLDKPAKLNEHGCVDCSKCNVEHCVHRDCMRRNPRNVGGLGECPRLDNGVVSEAQKVAEETGMELAEAELAVNVQNEQKKPRKARKSKDIAYEGQGVTLTAKQVDFLLDLKQTEQWEGLESKLFTDLICDEIEGQFAGKPMTVGAMISTLCEKGLAERFKGQFTDPVTGRTRKSTYMELTHKGWEVARELGLA